MANPFLTYAGVLERSSHLIHMYVSTDPQVVGYQFWGAAQINDAYGNPAGSGVGGAGAAAQFEVARGDYFRSVALRRKGLAAIPENRKGSTQFAFDPDDFLTPGGVMPPDDQWLCVRLQENRNGVGLLELAGGPAPVLGPIYLVPPASAYGQSAPTFTAQAIAPSDTGCVAGLPPLYNEDLTSAVSRPMHLVFSSPLVEFTLRNLSGANTFLASFGAGQPMLTVPVGGEVQLFNGRTKELVLACPDVGGCAFSLHGVLGRG